MSTKMKKVKEVTPLDIRKINIISCLHDDKFDVLENYTIFNTANVFRSAEFLQKLR